MSSEDTVCELENTVFAPHFAIDSDGHAHLPEGLEVLLAWRLAERKRSRSHLKHLRHGGIDSLAKMYYPLWAIPFGDRLALLDPLVREPSSVGNLEIPSTENFIDQLQAAHFRRSSFRNILLAHQNTFSSSEPTKQLSIYGLLKDSDAVPIIDYVAKSGRRVPPDSVQGLSIADLDHGVVAEEVTRLSETTLGYVEGLKRLELALKVLETETNHQISELQAEIAGIKAEHSHEIESAQEILRQSIRNLLKRRDAEMEIVASRFSEIHDILTSDISHFRKVHASLTREGGYLHRMTEARVGVNKDSNADLVKKLLGDHPQRLKILEDEVERIQYLIKIVEEERGRQLAAVEALYSELIKARSRITSDLEIDRDVEINRRQTEIEDLSEIQTKLVEKITSLIDSVKTHFKKTDWLVPNTLNLREASLLFIPIYVAYCIGQPRDDALTICAPGYFSQSLPPVGCSYELEDRVKPISYHSQSLLEASLPLKAQRSSRIRERIVGLAEAAPPFTSLVPGVLEGLKLASEKGWVSDLTYSALEKSLSQGSAFNSLP